MRPVRRSGLRAAIALAGALAVLAVPAPATAQEELLQELKKISSVRIEGRHHVSLGAVRSAMKTREPSIRPWRETPLLRFDYLRADVLSLQQLYRRYGYLDTQVGFQVVSARKSDEVVVVFRVEEGLRSRIDRVSFPGASAIPEPELARRLWARPGRPFDPAYLQLDTLRLVSLYEEKGYRPHVEASAWRDSVDSLRVAVSYRIFEGEKYHVGAVTVTGRVVVNERLVTRELVVTPGAGYQRSRVVRSQERLYETGLFSQVQIEPVPDSSHTLMDMAVRLRERKPRWIDAGVGSGTEERLRVVGEWGHRNVLGRALQAVVSSRLSFGADGKFQRWHIEGSLLEPWLLGTRTRGRVTPYFERNDDRADPSWVVRQEFRGLDFLLSRELNRFTRLNLTQGNLYTRQTFGVVDPSLSPAERDSLEKVLAQTVVPQYTTHRLAVAFERDTRDNPFRPARGAVTLISAEVAGGPFHGTSSFRKTQLVSAWFTPMSNGWILATRGVAGVIEPFGPRPQFSPGGVDSEVARVPLEDRFRIGGVNSIRYYDENSIPPSGGLAVLQGNIELRATTPVRVPLLGSLGFEIYLDAGNVWERPEYIQLRHLASGPGESPNAVKYVVGVGPRVDLPIGPLRIDLSWKVRPTLSHAKMQFAIGPSF